MINPIATSHKPSPVFKEGGSLSEKVTKTASYCFDALQQIVTFPFRYLGSKTWSIPGLILRTPLIVFKRLFGLSNESLRSELFGAGYHFSFEKTLTPEELRPFLPYACLGGYMDKTLSKFIPPGWAAVPLSRIRTEFDSIQRNERCLFNPATGLKIALLEKGNEVVIGFGAQDALKVEVEDKKQQDAAHSQVQVTTVSNLLGLKPEAYEEAERVTQQLLKDPFFNGKSVVLTGQSYGGGLAAYVGIKQKLTTICVNPVPMGVGLQQKIGFEALKDAGGYVTHITSKNDWSSDAQYLKPLDRLVSFLGLRTPGNFGRRFLIPSAYKSCIDSHIHFLGSAMQYLGHSNRTLPSELPIS